MQNTVLYFNIFLTKKHLFTLIYFSYITLITNKILHGGYIKENEEIFSI